VDVARFALRRFHAVPTRWLLGALGLAAAFGGLLVALVSPTVAGDVALRNELASQSVSDRLVTAVSTDGRRGADPDLDAYVRGLFNDRGMADVARLTSVSQLPMPDGDVFRIVGVDHLPAAVRLIDGRLPKPCSRGVCEGVLWERDKAPKNVALDPTLKVKIVGTVTRADERILSGTFKPEDREAVIFLDGADAPNELDSLASIDRTTGWVAAIDPQRMSLADVPKFLRQLATMGERNDVAHLVVTAPDSTVREVARRARITINRLALPVGEASALLAGFAMITTFSVRPWHRRGLEVLRLRCSTRVEEWRFNVTEASLLVIMGALFGIVVGGVGTAYVAVAANVTVRSTLDDFLDWHVLGPFVGLVVVSLLAVLVILRGSEETPRAGRRVWISDVLAVAAIGLWLFAAKRSTATTDTLASGTDPLVSITPALAGIAAAGITMRFLPMLLKVLKHLIPARFWVARLAVAGAPRRRHRTLATAAFVTASLTMATFALGYRTTLQAGSFDQAAFAVPMDITLREGPKLVPPQQVRSATQWSQEVKGVFASNVLRRGLSVRRSGTASDTVEVLGVSPQALDHLRSWRKDFGRRPRPGLIAVAPPAQSGIVLPASPRFLTLTSSAVPSDIELGMVLERADGTWHETLATPDESQTRWTIEFNPFDHDVRLQGFRIGHLHSVGPGGANSAVIDIDVELQSVSIDGQPVDTDLAGLWSATATLDAADDAKGAHVRSTVRGSTDLLFFGKPPESPVPAIVDASTASTATNGIVTLEIPGQGVLRVRVVQVAARFPTVGSRFAVLDQVAMTSTLDRVQPGLGAATEMWIAADNAETLHQLHSAVTGSEFEDIDRVVRTEVQSQLSGDTLAKAVMLAFLVSSLLCALLSAVAMIFVAHSDRLDELAVFRGLRTSGATAGQLSGVLRARCLVLLAAAAPVGVGSGLVLLEAVRDLISVSATGTAPIPDLRVVTEPPLIAVVVVAVALVSLLGTMWIGRSMRSINRHESLAAHE
jgi:hypothetical protein